MNTLLLAMTETQQAAVRVLDNAAYAVMAHGEENDMFNNFDGDVEALRTIEHARGQIITDMQQNCFHI